VDFPVITVGIVRGRDNQEWFDTALRSVSQQIYRNFKEIDLVIVENFDRKKSIGKCFNEIAQESKGEWVFYLGDDDHISPDYLLSLMLRYFQSAKSDKTIVNIISYSTKFNTEIKVISSKSPTGIWLKDYIINNKFDETLERYVDTEMFKRLNLSDKYYPTIASHQYGYYYRQHDDNISGNKIERGDYDRKFNKEIYKDKEVNRLLHYMTKNIKSVTGSSKHDVIGLLAKDGSIYSIKDLLGEF